MAGHSTRRKTYSFKRSRPQTPSTAWPNQFLFEASDLAAEDTPKASGTCDEAEEAQRRPSTKRALLSDLYSELEDEVTSLIASDIPSRQKPEEGVFSFDKQAFEAQFLFSLFSLIPGKNCSATSRAVLKSSLFMITLK